MSKDLYDVVGDRISEFWNKTYYGSVIASFDQSYDGKEWEHQVEFASFENGDFETVVFRNDWNEGQTHLRNLRIWHLEDSVPVVRCKDCKYFKTYPPTEDQDYTIYDCERLNYCTDNAVGNKPDDFCSRGERKEVEK